jgi:Mut7-C ubiquitin
MAVRVELTLLLQRYVPNYDQDNGIVIEDGAGKAIRQIIAELGIPLDKVFQVLVNHLPSQDSYIVKEGDLVTLAMILGAG